MKPETNAVIAKIVAAAVKVDIPIKWKSASRMPGGDRRSPYKGTGREFFEITTYNPGDDVRLINWAATARSPLDEPMKTLRVEPRQAYMSILLDISPTMNYGTTRVTKRTLGAELAASVMTCAKRTHDRVSFTSYSAHKVHDYYRPQSANALMYPALVSALEAKTSLEPPNNGLAQALSGLPNIRSLVFIMSDFMQMSEKDWRALANAGVMHDVVCFYCQDIRERELPIVPWPGCPYTFQDPYGNETTIWNRKATRAKYSANFRLHEANIIARLKKCYCNWLVISTEEGDAALPKLINVFLHHNN